MKRITETDTQNSQNEMSQWLLGSRWTFSARYTQQLDPTASLHRMSWDFDGAVGFRILWSNR